MKSEFADVFNHDKEATAYDDEVLDETNPIRTGYNEVLDWVAAHANSAAGRNVLELGAGTGNLSQRLKAFKALVCVDISTEMTRINRRKLASFKHVTWVLSDVLEFFDESRQAFDAVISTYAVHHLTEAEKQSLYKRVWSVLTPGGVAVFGDLMFENETGRQQILNEFRRSGRERLADEIEAEFFWDVALATRRLRQLGFEVRVRKFSQLSWGLFACKPLTNQRKNIASLTNPLTQ